MNRTMRALLVALVSASAIVAFAAGASARTLRVDEQRFDLKWTETVPLRMIVGANTISCPITLRGRFESALINKTVTRIGEINTVIQEEARCAGLVIFRASATLPWEVMYEAFTGTLPNITSMRVQLLRASFTRPATGCNYVSEAGKPFKATFNRNTANGELREITPDSTAGINGTGAAGCEFTTATFGTAGTPSRQASTNKILMTLI